MNGERGRITDREIGRHLKAGVEASPLSQGEIARRTGVGTQAASEYVNASSGGLSDKFKPLAFLLEIARSSRAAFDALLPLLGQHQIAEPPDPELREIVEDIVAQWPDVPMRERIRSAVDLAIPDRQQKREKYGGAG